MSELLAQAEADKLLAMEKHRTDDKPISLPDMGGSLIDSLISADGVETFFLDIARGRINLGKGKFQSRARTTIVLARVDIGGSPHRNPDDTEISCPHLHLYREGFGDKWAFDLPPDVFKNPASHWQTLIDFMVFVNITHPPEFLKGLFT